jgi:hypothetical protein
MIQPETSHVCAVIKLIVTLIVIIILIKPHRVTFTAKDAVITRCSNWSKQPSSHF